MATSDTKQLKVWLHAGVDAPLCCGYVIRVEHGSNHQTSSFSYSEEHLAKYPENAINPGYPLETKTYSTALLRGNFSSFLDVCPGAWGRKSRMSTEQSNGDIDELLVGVHDQVGALSFTRESETPGEPFNGYDTVHLEKMLRLSRAFEQGQNFWRKYPRFITNLGGARPKFTLVSNGAQWIAKLPSALDLPTHPSNPRLEAAVMKLGKLCGLNVPDSQLISVDGRDVLLVRRFDREIKNGVWLRHKFASLRSIFHSKPEVQRYVLHGSYLRFARELNGWSSQSEEDKRELFKRVTFNCLVSNTDDHDLNHGMIDTGSGFKLSPVFDVVPQQRTSRRLHLVLGVGEYGTEASLRNLLSNCEVFGLSKEEAQYEIAEIEAVVKIQWRECLGSYGIPSSQQELLTNAFCPEFFRSPA
jgi:serine/threonine-protein kinase HipA